MVRPNAFAVLRLMNNSNFAQFAAIKHPPRLLVSLSSPTLPHCPSVGFFPALFDFAANAQAVSRPAV